MRSGLYWRTLRFSTIHNLPVISSCCSAAIKVRHGTRRSSKDGLCGRRSTAIPLNCSGLKTRGLPKSRSRVTRHRPSDLHATITSLSFAPLKPSSVIVAVSCPAFLKTDAMDFPRFSSSLSLNYHPLPGYPHNVPGPSRHHKRYRRVCPVQKDHTLP